MGKINDNRGFSGHRVIAKKIQHARMDGDLSQRSLADRVAEVLHPYRILGEQLEACRRHVGLTQEELHRELNLVLDACGTSGTPERAAISKAERGKRGIDFLEGIAICIVLGISPWELVTEDLAKQRPKPRPARLYYLEDQVELEGAWRYTFRHATRERYFITYCSETELQFPPGVDVDWVKLEDVMKLNKFGLSQKELVWRVG